MPYPSPDAYTNALGQPIGFPVEGWRKPPRPTGAILNGHYCRLERLHPESHAESLFHAYSTDTEHRTWTYLGYGPFATVDEYRRWIFDHIQSDDPLFYAVVDEQSGRALGVASYLRINPEDGVIEVGHISFSPLLKKTATATEAMFLMMRHVFDDLGYRRYEWKCDALNAPSRMAAARLGFTFEGIFRQATMYRQRNRDTAWFSIIDSEWLDIKTANESWLAPGNFDHGRQKQSLAGMMRTVRDEDCT